MNPVAGPLTATQFPHGRRHVAMQAAFHPMRSVIHCRSADRNATELGHAGGSTVAAVRAAREPPWPVDLRKVRLWQVEGEDGPLLQELFDDLVDFRTPFGEPGSADAVSTFIALPGGPRTRLYESIDAPPVNPGVGPDGPSEALRSGPDPRRAARCLLCTEPLGGRIRAK